MAEYIREVAVTIEVDTNKQTYTRRLTLGDNETHEEFEHRVAKALSELMELS
jgi:hypothetical protein